LGAVAVLNQLQRVNAGQHRFSTNIALKLQRDGAPGFERPDRAVIAAAGSIRNARSGVRDWNVPRRIELRRATAESD
jgi:hypothetical protein